MNDDGKLLGKTLLFPYELTTSDYLRRLFVCLSNGIRGPICSIVAKDCVPMGLMEPISNYDSHDPILLLRILLGAYKVCGVNEKEVKRYSFDIQSIFHSYMGNRKSYVRSIDTLLREAMYLRVREFQMEAGGRLSNLSVIFAAARDLLESFNASFDSCKYSVIHMIELQTQCEKHRRWKEERCVTENRQWPAEKVEEADNTLDVELDIDKKDPKMEAEKVTLGVKVSEVVTSSMEKSYETRKLLQTDNVYKYICFGRLEGVKRLLEVRTSRAIKERQPDTAKVLRQLHIAVSDTAKIVGESSTLDTSTSLDNVFISKFEKMKLSVSDLQLLEEECLALEALECLPDLQSCLTNATQLMDELNDIIAAPSLKFPLSNQSELTSDLVFTTRYKDGLSIEILSFRCSSMALCRSILRWPGITTFILTSSQLDIMNENELSNALCLRHNGVPAYKLLRVGLTVLQLLKVGFEKDEIMRDMAMLESVIIDDREDNMCESKGTCGSSSVDFEKLLYVLKSDGHNATHCLSVGFRLKDLFKVGFREDECMNAIVEAKKFIPASVDDTPTNATTKSVYSSSSIDSPSEVINGKLLRSFNIDYERYALTMLYQALDGPNWRCKDNWLSDKPLCQWYGVVCEDHGRDSRVVTLNLRGNNIIGRIPDSLIYLELLRCLDFDFNDIVGSAYDVLKLLPSLRDLWLQGNKRVIENVDYASKSRLKELIRSSAQCNIKLDTVSPLKSPKKHPNVQ